MGTDAAELVAKCSLTTEETLEVNREMKATDCVQELPAIPESTWLDDFKNRCISMTALPIIETIFVFWTEHVLDNTRTVQQKAQAIILRSNSGAYSGLVSKCPPRKDYIGSPRCPH